MIKNLKPKFIKSGSYESLEIWDRYLDQKYLYITEKLIFSARFRNFPSLYTNTIFSKSLNNYDEGKTFEIPFDFFLSHLRSFRLSFAYLYNAVHVQ